METELNRTSETLDHEQYEQRKGDKRLNFSNEKYRMEGEGERGRRTEGEITEQSNL